MKVDTILIQLYVAGDTGKQAVTKKHVLVMDEVDGMAGNEDRGKSSTLFKIAVSFLRTLIYFINIYLGNYYNMYVGTHGTSIFSKLKLD